MMSHKDIIVHHFHQLQTKTRIHCLQVSLLSRDVIKFIQKQHTVTFPNEQEQVALLLRYIQRSYSQTFQRFLNALRQDKHEHIDEFMVQYSAIPGGSGVK